MSGQPLLQLLRQAICNRSSADLDYRLPIPVSNYTWLLHPSSQEPTLGS